MTRRIVVAIALATGPACSEHSTAQAQTYQFRQVSPDNAACAVNRIMTSSKGYVALWNSPKYDLLAKNPHITPLSVFDPKQPRIITVPTGPSDLIPMKWSDDGENLFLRSSNNSVHALNATTLKVTYVGDIPSTFGNSTIEFGNTNDIRDLIAERYKGQSSQHQSKAAVKKWFFIDNGIMSYVYLSSLDLSLRDSSDKYIGNGVFLRNLRFSDGTRGATTVFDSIEKIGGVSYRTRPIIDEVASKFIGNFPLLGQPQVLLLKDNIQVDILEKMQERSQSLDVSINGGSSALLYAHHSGSINVAISNGEGNPIDAPVCKSVFKEFHKGDVSFSSRNLLASDAFIAQGSHFPAILYKHNSHKSADDLIIHFGGGPAQSLYDDPVPSIVRRFLPLDVDVLVSDYPGSAGPVEAPVRFGPNPSKLMEEATISIKSWLDREGSRYKRIIVVSESFGALPARSLIKVIDRRRAISIYIAPLVKLKQPEDWLTSSEGISVENQLRFEEAAFGKYSGRAAWKKYIKSTWSNEIRDNEYFFFAQRDAKSLASDIVVDTNHKFEISYVNHNSILGSAELWDKIKLTIAQHNFH